MKWIKGAQWLSEEYEKPIDVSMVSFALVDLYRMTCGEHVYWPRQLFVLSLSLAIFCAERPTVKMRISVLEV